MRILRAIHPEVLKYLPGKLVLDEGETEELVLSQIRELINRRDGRCFLPVCLDKEELKAFIVAVSHPDQTHVYVYQAWAEPGFPSILSKKMFLQLLLWTSALGHTHLRMETRRSPEGFMRRWGFEHYSTTMAYRIPKNFEDTLLLGTSGELDLKQKVNGDS